MAVFVQHQGTNFQFTVVRKPHQGTAAKRGVIVWRAPFLFLFWRSKKEKKPAAGVGKKYFENILGQDKYLSKVFVEDTNHGAVTNFIFTKPIPSIAYLRYSFEKNLISKVMVNGIFI